VRFCLLTTFYPPWNFGGDGIQVQRLARVLAGRGHEVTVVHSREGYAALGYTPPAPAAREEGVRRVAIDSGRGRVSPIVTYLTGRPLLARAQLERVLDERFDVLHFHNPSLLGGPALLRMGAGIKLYTAHEQWLVCPMHTLWQDRERICVQPHCWRCSARYKRPPQLWRSTGLMADAVGHLDALITPSDTSATLHAELASLVRMETLEHFLPDPGGPEGAVESAGPSTGDPYVLFVGRLEEIKGPQTLLAALRGWSRARLVIAGAGSLEGELRARIAALSGGELVGWQEPQELDALIRGALAVIVPSVGHESFGLVPIEALARGTPAIVRDFGALSELVVRSDAVIGYRENAQLVAALDGLLDDPPRRVELGRIARADYLAHFTEHSHLARYFGLIAQLATARGEGSLAADAAAAAARESEQAAA
jgi:glycosyltransferase involved in cell wall biosynthesis